MATNNNDKKISQLPLADPLTGSEIVPIVQNGRNRRITAIDLVSLAEGIGQSSVKTVNGKSGANVVLTAADVGAATISQGLKADSAEQVSHKNQPLGYAGLDGSGKLPLSLLPSGALELKGSWSASTNAPLLQNGTGTSGDMYIVTTAGTVDFGDGPISFEAGDSVVYGTDGKYFRSVNAVSVLSVNSKTGAVLLDKNDVGLDNVDNTSDLDKPVSSATQAQLDLKADTNSLSLVATSGSYSDLLNRPSIPDVSPIQSDITGLRGDIANLQQLINLLSSGENISLITRETPTGQINGINKLFTLANTPIAGSEQVFLNGILQEQGASADYTIIGDTITFSVAPQTLWTVFVNYSYINEEESGPPPLHVFQWSNSEQVYPFERSTSGATLYCKEIDVGFLACKGGKSVPHGIENYSAANIHNISGTINNTVGSDSVSLNSLAYGGNFCILDSSNVNVYTPNADCTKYRCKVRLIYSK